MAVIIKKEMVAAILKIKKTSRNQDLAILFLPFLPWPDLNLFFKKNSYPRGSTK
jgi:hypothetical protein